MLIRRVICKSPRHYDLQAKPTEILELDALAQRAKDAGIPHKEFPKILVEHGKKEVLFTFFHFDFDSMCFKNNQMIALVE